MFATRKRTSGVWRAGIRGQGAEGKGPPVKSATLVFSEEFNGASRGRGAGSQVTKVSQNDLKLKSNIRDQGFVVNGCFLKDTYQQIAVV